MLAVFCLRLAVGMMACLLILTPSIGPRPAPQSVGGRFYRTHFLTALALSCLALLFLRDRAGWPVLTAVAAGVALAFLGSVAWSLESASGRAPGGRVLIVLVVLALVVGLALQETADKAAAAFTSAALLGAALTAMLLGHHYLIAPAMSISPLMRVLAVLAVALLARATVDGYLLARWTSERSLVNLQGDVFLWLPLRWGVGLLAPLVLTWMAWRTARIRSTQSATGILYVVVIFCFLGELTGLLLE